MRRNSAQKIIVTTPSPQSSVSGFCCLDSNAASKRGNDGDITGCKYLVTGCKLLVTRINTSQQVASYVLLMLNVASKSADPQV
jgi:hypothetical protein